MQISLAGLKPLLIDLILPSRCPLCASPSDDQRTMPVCSACWTGMEKHGQRGCRTCAALTEYDSSGVCQECRTLNPVFDRVIAYGVFDGVLREVIHRIKFGKLKRLAKVLGREMESLPLDSADLIVPVPLSAGSLRTREFNQSALMARSLSKATGIPFELEGLRKIKETLPQSTLARRERRDNVKGAYTAKEVVKGKRVLLVDDVVTTGATVNECAKVLKKAGASGVTVVTAARARNN